MDWVRAAAERLVNAERELRAAQEGLRNNVSADEAKGRYANAVRELEKAKRFVARVSRGNEVHPIGYGEGLFG